MLVALLALATGPGATAHGHPARPDVGPGSLNAAAMTTPSTAPEPGGVAWRPPVDDPVLERPFAAPLSRWGAGHRGVDLAVRPGTPVRTPATGTVTFAGRVVDRDLVTITHADGLRSSLEPVAVAVSVGDVLAAGAVVGDTSTGGHCGDRCLHWGVRRGDTYVDPLTLLGGGPVVLLPLER